MKGGNYLALEAIRQLTRASFTTPLPVTVVFTPDEEVGTPRRDLIEAEARRNKYVLVPEPGRSNNGFLTGRYAIARSNLEAVGRPSHAGATLSSGRSAIREMARQILMKVMRGVTRPVWEPDAGAMALRRTEVSPGEQPARMGSGFAQHGDDLCRRY